MNATVSQPTLKSALTDVSRAVNKRSTLPVLSNVHVTIDVDHVTLYATDLETAVQVAIPAETSGTGPTSFTMPARRALDFVKSADKFDSIIIDPLADAVALRHGRASVTLPTIASDEYPVVSDIGPAFAEVDGPAFIAAMRRALICASSDDVRPILAAVHFAPAAGAIVLASADNYRLQTSGIDVSWIAPDVEPFTVNVDSCRIAATVLKSADIVTLHRMPANTLGAMRRAIVAGDVRIVGRIIDGTFPNYESVIPRSFNVSSSFDVSDLSAAVKSVRTAARDDADRVDVSLNGSLELRTSGASAVVSAVTSGLDDPYGMALVTLNVGYLADALSTMSGTGRLWWNGPLSPIMLTDETDGYRTVVMPVRRP
jgi:DNA polymerase-3 subunit beta